MTSRTTLLAITVVVALAGPLSLSGRQPSPRAREAPQPARVPAPAAAGAAHVELEDTESATCLMCHEGIDKAKVQHAPVSAGMCTACHEFKGKGESTVVVLAANATTGDTAPLCVTCHDDIASTLKSDGTHAPAASGDCTLCRMAPTGRAC